jgi:hypothetical protein
MLNLFGLFTSDVEKRFITLTTGDQCYKTFFVRNLGIFVIS